jgi:peroxiredoxin Q/BCP
MIDFQTMRRATLVVRLFTGLAFGSCLALTALGCSSSSATTVAAGTQAPTLVATDHRGTDASLASFRGQHVLVYFYPRDATPGCTTEACSIRDVWSRYTEKKIVVLGVSNDSVESHKKFAADHELPFGLVADTDGAWAKAFGVPERAGFYARMSFLIGPEGTIIKVFPNVDPGVHANEVLSAVEQSQP